MKISELLKSGKVSVSCEIFPPKQGGETENVMETARKIAGLSPSFISVTFGAGGGTARTSIPVATGVQKLGIPALAHLTCVSSTRRDTAAMLDRMKENGIENVLALRGDIPQEMEFPTPRQYRYAYELVREIRARGDFCVGAACYPDGHVECEHKDDDIRHLKQKVDCGCDFLTSQMFFDNNVFYNFYYRILSAEIRVPVIAGIMPVTNSKQIKRICAMSGTTLPPRFRAIVDKFSSHPAAMKQAGIAYATEQIIDLISNGVNAVHIYTMNKPGIAAKIFESLGEIIR